MWSWRKLKFLVAACAVLFLVFSLGMYVGMSGKIAERTEIFGILHKTQTDEVKKPDIDFEPFWKAWGLLEKNYVDSASLEREKMLYGAISGLFKSTGDPYTVFFPPKENKEFQVEIKGEFEGIGIEIGIRKGVLTVIAPLKNTPAYRAGIRAGDKILKIDDTSAGDLSIEEAVQLIRGPRGTKVKLGVIRNGEDAEHAIEVTRDVIHIPVLDTEVSSAAGQSSSLIDYGDIFVIRLYNFSETSPQLFREALRKMIAEKKQKLILDLRNNPGGYLEAAVDISSWFLPSGEVVVREASGKGGEQIHRGRGYNIFRNLPMVILINQGSASASEIVAGALSDHNIAKLVGERTFGKGSVQELLPLTDETSVKITIAKWLTPNGHTIAEKGLDPDIEIKPKEEDIKAGRDVAMEKAVEMLKNATGKLQ